MNEHLKLLGIKVRDAVTGFTGVVSSISFDLFGCVQAVVSPPVNNDGVLGEGRWFDTKRLVVLEPDPVMQVPSFDLVPGGQALPRQSRY